ncbi:MAG TPA: urocanate hydratase [Thermoanaerobaculaceae bacterium]|nr:urocanate hydratase [Thermoanaerobaculaceae bacterium]HPS77202.1 urocanate hydratase [Thermoanaerobaculaceae bacterium]
MPVTFELDLAQLPPTPAFEPGIRRAPSRGFKLNAKDAATALSNALRYLPARFHDELAAELMDELVTRGRIYGYRFRPPGRIFGRPIHEYPGKILDAKGMQVMIDNNLDFEVALYPYELVTYGETGQVFQNWMQYQLCKRYLSEMTADQTLVVSSGHPLGLFPSRPEAPRVIITNGLMVGAFDTPESFHRLAAMGCVNYGQMTAGGWMYIGPQGIVHGTYITLLGAGRRYLGIPQSGDLRGHTFVSSGLGGMSGAQPRAVEIAGGVGVIAEVDASRIKTRHDQGWVSLVSDSLPQVVEWMSGYQERGEPISIAYHGNVVDLLEYLEVKRVPVDLLSDQTSCHAVYEGGYTPAGLSFEQGRELLGSDSAAFKAKVDASLLRHYTVLRRLTSRGARFWDYGNSFMKAVFDAGVPEIARNGEDTNDGFIWPSYVEDIMGPLCFDYGYGPFRWICLSGSAEDLKRTDHAAMACIDPARRGQDRDNYNWIHDAARNRLVVGTQARILYADAEGRVRIALAFNDLVRRGEIGPVIIGRDHHDVSGTDSPFRETANIYDGSSLTSDMSHQCFAGNIARGMTYVVLSNGGGVGTGKAINGGNGILLDGSERIDEVLASGLDWDVTGGVARRSWARNPNAIETVRAWNERQTGRGHITVPELADGDLVAATVTRALARRT